MTRRDRSSRPPTIMANVCRAAPSLGICERRISAWRTSPPTVVGDVGLPFHGVPGLELRVGAAGDQELAVEAEGRRQNRQRVILERGDELLLIEPIDIRGTIAAAGHESPAIDAQREAVHRPLGLAELDQRLAGLQVQQGDGAQAKGEPWPATRVLPSLANATAWTIVPGWPNSIRRASFPSARSQSTTSPSPPTASVLPSKLKATAANGSGMSPGGSHWRLGASAGG